MAEINEIQEMHDKLERKRREIYTQQERLIDDVTMQAISLVLLKHFRSKGTIKPPALNEIRFAREQAKTGEYDPRKQLERILSETVMDREIRRETP